MHAKDIVIRVIGSADANRVCKLFHYSKKVVPNSQIHFGVFLNEVLLGVMQFGPSTDKRRMAMAMKCGMNDFIELNRMAFSDVLPRNSESRAISIALRILKKKYSFLKMVISFADACQCGDGTIYRASGFNLLQVKKNSQLLLKPNGEIIAVKTLNNSFAPDGRRMSALAREAGWQPIHGYMLKYVYFFDKNLKNKFDFIDFSTVKNQVSMYKGNRAVSKDNVASDDQLEEGGATPTTALQETSA